MSASKINMKSSPKNGKRAPKLSQIERTTQAVLDATVDLLSEIGYRSLTVELISQRSGVARSTIYRHWKNVPELAVQAFDTAIGPYMEMPGSGSIRKDLILLYKGLSQSLERSIWGRALPALIEASHNDPNFRGLISELANSRRESARQLLQRAKKRGELKKTANIEWILDSISGPLYHRLLISGAPLSEKGLIEWLIDNALSDTLHNK